jgi:hypothetical protein
MFFAFAVIAISFVLWSLPDGKDNIFFPIQRNYYEKILFKKLFFRPEKNRDKHCGLSLLVSFCP